MKPNFVLPETKLCTVLWNDNGTIRKQLLDTPANNASLFHTMLMKHRVGFSQIRAVQSVNSEIMLNGFGRSFR